MQEFADYYGLLQEIFGAPKLSDRAMAVWYNEMHYYTYRDAEKMAQMLHANGRPDGQYYDPRKLKAADILAYKSVVCGSKTGFNRPPVDPCGLCHDSGVILALVYHRGYGMIECAYACRCTTGQQLVKIPAFPDGKFDRMSLTGMWGNTAECKQYIDDAQDPQERECRRNEMNYRFGKVGAKRVEEAKAVIAG